MPEPELLGYKQAPYNGSANGSVAMENGQKELPPVETTDSEGEEQTRPSTADPDKTEITFSKDLDKKKNDKDKKDKDEKDDKDEKKEEPMVGFCEVFKFADCIDGLLMLLGSLCALAHGAALPCMIIVFGDMTDLFVNSGKLMYFLDRIPEYLSLNSISRSSVIADPTVLIGQETNISAFYPNQTFDFTILTISAQESLLDTMTTFALYYVGIGCGVLVMGYGQVVCWVTAAERQAHRIRVNFFRNVMRQEIGWFDTHESGELNTRLADDINKIHAGIGDKMGSFMQWFAGFLAGFAIGFAYGWKLTLVITAISPLLAITGFIMNKLVSAMSTKELDAYARAGAIAEEVLGAIRTVLAFGGQEKECARYNKNLDEAKAFGIKKGLTNGLTMGTIWLVMFGAYALGFWYGAKLIRDESDNYTAGKTLIVFFSVLIGAFSLGNAAPNLQSLATARGAAYIVFAIIDQEPNIDSSSDKGEKPSTVTGNVKFRNIKFRYPARTEVQVLKGISLDVNRGETVALVGSSGCGKSTMVQLMQRFYDPEEGDISLDGRDLKSLNVKWLRQHIGVVSQEPILFATTIAENIRYGRPDVTQEEIEAAARMANAHDFVSKLPEKYNTLVGERGAQLSGGQKQRIAIARAMVRDPKILLLDEATSALDTESESVVQQALDKARTGRTTIVVAHRLSTIKTADTIAGFKEGILVEKGTHDELMKKGGVYYTLVTMQTKDVDEEEEELIAEFTGSKTQQKPSKKQLERVTSVQSDVVDVQPDKKKKDKDDKKKKEDKIPEASLKQILRTNAPEWPYITGGCLASIVNGGVQPAFAVIFAEILGVFSLSDLDEQEKEITKYVLILVGLGVGSFFTFLVQGYFFGVSGENLTMRLRQLVFKAMLRQDIAWFDDHKNTTGALTTRLATDASQVQGAAGARLGTFVQNLANMGTALVLAFIYGWKLTLVILAFLPLIAVAGALEMKLLTGIAGARLGTIVQSLSNIGAAIVIAFVYGWKLTLVVLAFLPLVGIGGYLEMKILTGVAGARLGSLVMNLANIGTAIVIAFVYGWKLTLVILAFLPPVGFAGFIQMRILTGVAGANKEALEDAGKIATEGIENIRTVAGLTMEIRILDLYKAALVIPYNSALRKAHVTAIAFSVSQGVLFFAYAASFWFGAYLIEQDEMNYTDVFKVFSVIVFGAMALGQASAFAPDASKAQVSAGHIYHLLGQEPKVDPYSTEGEKPTAGDFVSNVRFKECHFHYPTRPDVEVLQGLTFNVDPGETIALVGASGCGKSTCVQLIERFYDVEEGEVSLDKYNIKSLNVQWLRKQIGIVSQEPILFDCSIAENIAYGDNTREVSMDEIILASRNANIHEFIASLPNGYDTNVGEKGTQLSGGQKQRVAIARALVRNPKILLLDEATSALDTESEKVVQDALDKARSGRTCLVIAHRLSTIQNADKICVIKHGQVAEQGRHGDLMSSQGIYYRLISKAQSRGK